MLLHWLPLDLAPARNCFSGKIPFEMLWQEGYPYALIVPLWLQMGGAYVTGRRQKIFQRAPLASDFRPDVQGVK